MLVAVLRRPGDADWRSSLPSADSADSPPYARPPMVAPSVTTAPFSPPRWAWTGPVAAPSQGAPARLAENRQPRLFPWLATPSAAWPSPRLALPTLNPGCHPGRWRPGTLPLPSRFQLLWKKESRWPDGAHQWRAPALRSAFFHHGLLGGGRPSPWLVRFVLILGVEHAWAASRCSGYCSLWLAYTALLKPAHPEHRSSVASPVRFRPWWSGRCQWAMWVWVGWWAVSLVMLWTRPFPGPWPVACGGITARWGIPMVAGDQGAAHTTTGADRPLRQGHGPDQMASECWPSHGWTASTGLLLLHSIPGLDCR